MLNLLMIPFWFLFLAYPILDWLPWPWNRKRLIIHCSTAVNDQRFRNEGQSLPSWLGINIFRVIIGHPWKMLGLLVCRGIRLQQKETASNKVLEAHAVGVNVDQEMMKDLLELTGSDDNFSML
jgi:hypothetical protein